MAISYQLSAGVLESLLPRPDVGTAEWAAANILMPSDSKVRGSFRLDLFPHCREIFDALDDPNISVVTVQTAAQVGKTTIAQAYLAKVAACNPHPMAWADADEKSTRRVLARTWRMFERTKGLTHLCPARQQQATDRIETSTFLIHGAWARSSSSAADYGAYVVVLNETDKMHHASTSQEADFRYLMCERTKGYVGAKILELSTPTTKGTSYIEQRRLRGDNRAWLVPCPHCGHFQPLKTGDGKSPGGIKFEKLDGKLDPNHAERTAYFECVSCLKRIDEHQRYGILQGGRWVAEGCRISTAGTITGTPTRSGPHASFGPLPTLASLLPGISIGKVARELVEALTSTSGRSEKLRNFRNSWEGETWDPRPKTITSHELVNRLSVELPPRLCPEWSRFLTVGCDVGRINDDLLFYWMVSAWTRINGDGKAWGRRGHCVDKGITFGEAPFRHQIATWFAQGYPHADGGSPLLVKRLGIDSGAGPETNRIYGFCEPLTNVWPLKGSSHDMGLDIYDLGFQRTDVPTKILAARKKLGHGDLLLVNTHRTQGWRMDLTSGLVARDAPDWYSVPAEFCGDTDFLDELISDYPDESGGTLKWTRNGANEMGDALRYSFVLAELFAGAGWNNLPTRSGDAPKIASPRRPSAGTTPHSSRSGTGRHGRPFIASQRR